MRLTALCAATLALLTAAPCAAQRAPARMVRDAETAASCFARFVGGEALPRVPAPRPARNEAERGRRQLLSALGALTARDDGSVDAETADRLSRLRHCLPRSLRFDTQLSMDNARWLASCYRDGADRLRQASGRRARERAWFAVEGCTIVGVELASWGAHPGGVAGIARSPAAPGVVLDTFDRDQSNQWILADLDAAGPALAACRDAHGEGVVRVAARSGPRSWSVHGWPTRDAPVALADCVTAALEALPPPQGEPVSVGFDVALTTPPQTSPAAAGGRPTPSPSSSPAAAPASGRP